MTEFDGQFELVKVKAWCNDLQEKGHKSKGYPEHEDQEQKRGPQDCLCSLPGFGCAKMFPLFKHGDEHCGQCPADKTRNGCGENASYDVAICYSLDTEQISDQTCPDEAKETA